MNNQIITLYQQHENELKATIPDFAHQLEQLLKIKPKQIIYSDKLVAEYEQEMYKDGISKEMLKKLTVPTYKVGDIVTATDESSPLLHYGRYWKVIEFFVDDGIYRVRVRVEGGFATKEPVIYAVRKLNSSEKRDYIDYMKTKDEEMEVDLDDRLHPDFEENVGLLSQCEEDTINKLFIQHFDDDLNYPEQIALLSDTFSNKQLNNFVEKLRRSLHEEEVEVDLDHLKVDSDYEEHEIDTDIKG